MRVCMYLCIDIYVVRVFVRSIQSIFQDVIWGFWSLKVHRSNLPVPFLFVSDVRMRVADVVVFVVPESRINQLRPLSYDFFSILFIYFFFHIFCFSSELIKCCNSWCVLTLNCFNRRIFLKTALVNSSFGRSNRFPEN